MTFDQFTATLERPAPPDLPPLLRALWHAARGEWDAAHEIAQSIETADAAWVHAYLHRVEGDSSNARYWYRRARQPEATDSTPSEWARIAAALLDASR
jgi:hypothetical protein